MPGRPPSFFPRRLLVLTALSLLAAAITLITPLARGGGQPEGRVVASVFFVAKSENKNQVHYGIRLDPACRPVDHEPIFAYWRLLERGPFATEPLLPREQPAYGVKTQRTLKRSEQGGSVLITLNALPKRPIVIDSTTTGATCTAIARAMIEGVPASLVSVFVQLRWPFGVDSLQLAGRGTLDGHVVRERVGN